MQSVKKLVNAHFKTFPILYRWWWLGGGGVYFFCWVGGDEINAVKIIIYYMEESVLLGTRPLVDSIRHFIRDPRDVFSVCHLCECRIVQ